MSAICTFANQKGGVGKTTTAINVAAFLTRLHEIKDPFEAARFANATASFCVEAPGVTGIPTREQVQARLDSYSGFWE